MTDHTSPTTQSPAREDSQGLRPWAQRRACCADLEPCIEVRDLAVRYGDKPALDRVTLTIPRGCITAVVGPSGCGKSSFLNTLNRLSDLTAGCDVSGSVKFEGQEIVGTDLDLIALRRQVGMIFQKPNPFPLSMRPRSVFPAVSNSVCVWRAHWCSRRACCCSMNPAVRSTPSPARWWKILSPHCVVITRW